MNRLRKKADARNVPRQNDAFAGTVSSAPPFQQHFQHLHLQQPLLALPTITPGDEFRSSVIIPDLGRRFSILNYNGTLAADRIRSKLAQQRAAGDENRISEEEEDFLMYTLSSLQIDRSNNLTISSAPPGETNFPASVTSRPSFHSAFSAAESTSTSLYPMSALSSSTLTTQDPPFSGNGTPRSYRRASNNLFGSGQFRDRSYIRTARSGNGNRSLAFSTGAESGSSEPEQFSQIDETSEVEHGPGLAEEDQIRIQVSPAVVEDKAGYTASGSEGSSGSDRRMLPGTELTVAQARRMSRALERALSSLSSEDENGDLMDEETILAPPLARSFPRGSNSNQNLSPLLPSQQHHPHPRPHPQQLQQRQPQRQQELQSQNQDEDQDEDQDQNQNQTIRTEDIKAMLSYLSQTDIGLRALRETPELAEIINTTTSTTSTTTYSLPQHQQQPFRESELEPDSDSAASATSSSDSPYPPRNATASPVPDSSQRVPGYVPGMHRPITPQLFGNGVGSGTSREFDSDDYSTTPRATSPTNMSRHERSERERPAGGGVSMRPGISVREGGGVFGIAMEGASSIEGVLSGERDRRRGPDSPELTLSDLSRRRPASPLSQVHTVPSAPASRPSTGGSTSAQVNVNFSPSHSANARIPDATHSPSGSKSESNYSSSHSHNRVGSSSSSNLDQEHEQDRGITEAYAGGSGLARSKSIASRSIASPALPESPLIDNERNLAEYFHAGSGSQSWDNSSSKSMSPISVPPSLLYKNVTAGGSRPSTPNIQRPMTPGLGGQRSSTPVGAAGTAIARSPTPNYLLQRSPSATGYHSEYERPGSAMGVMRSQNHALAHSNSIRTTPSHTSSSSASNPLLQSSLDNSSRSSLESVGSSYHSSDGEMEDKKAKMLMTLLFEPDSERAKLVRRRLEGLTGSSSSFGGPGEGKKVNGFSFSNGERDQNGHGQPKGSDSPISTLGDQEDTLQLLTGLTKKDVASIQQKLISAYVTREAENALKASQRRRRPSVQSRDFATSPTPRPATNVNATTSIAPSADVTTQQPAPPGPSSSTSTTEVSPVNRAPSPPTPVAVPPSGRETPFKAEDQQSGSIPSPVAAVVNFSTANSTPASRSPSESDHAQKDANQPTSQGETPSPSPRARALAEALFGSGRPSPVSNAVRPLSASLSNLPIAPETSFVGLAKQITPDADLAEDVGRKAAAATAALKNSSEASNLGLRRKPTKKIQTSHISGPHLLSASMSVDAIPLASPVSTVVPTSPASHQDASSGSNSRASGRGLLGRLRSLRKSQQGSALEPIETVSSSLARRDSVSPSGQTIMYHPPSLHTPEIQSVPPPETTPSSPPQRQWPQSARPTRTTPIASPPATSGGLKGFMTRLRQSKGSARKEEAKGSPATPSVNLQKAAASPSPSPQQQDARRSPLHHQSPTHPLLQRVRGATSDNALPPIVATPQEEEEEEAVDAFRRAAKSLGLEEEVINGFLLQRSHSTTRTGLSDTRRHEGANSPPVASSPPSRQPSTRAKPIEANVIPRARVMRDGVDPLSTIVRRTIIVPSTSASAFPASSNIIIEGRNASPAPRKSSTRRRPPSATSQHSTKSPIMDRVPTPPPPRGGRRFSEDNRPPMPSLSGTNSPHPTPTNQGSHAGGYESPSSARPSIDNSRIDLNDASNVRGGVGIEVVELANGEVIWSVLDTLRAAHVPLDVEEDDSSLYFRDRMSVISHYTEPTEELQMTFKHPHVSPPRGAAHQSSSNAADAFRPETKVFYSDAKDITRLIEQITIGADSGSFNLVPKSPSRAGGGSFSTMHTTRTEDLPVEDQLDRLIQRVGVSDSPQLR